MLQQSEAETDMVSKYFSFLISIKTQQALTYSVLNNCFKFCPFSSCVVECIGHIILFAACHSFGGYTYT